MSLELGRVPEFGLIVAIYLATILPLARAAVLRQHRREGDRVPFSWTIEVVRGLATGAVYLLLWWFGAAMPGWFIGELPMGELTGPVSRDVFWNVCFLGVTTLLFLPVSLSRLAWRGLVTDWRVHRRRGHVAAAAAIPAALLLGLTIAGFAWLRTLGDPAWLATLSRALPEWSWPLPAIALHAGAIWPRLLAAEPTRAHVEAF